MQVQILPPLPDFYMGYTHYWNATRTFTDENWNAFIEEVRPLLAGMVNPFGDAGTTPVIEDDGIVFNGPEGDGYESCHISKQSHYNFCKTGRRPYDATVVAVLKLARKYNPSLKLSSDGGDEVFAIDIQIE